MGSVADVETNSARAHKKGRGREGEKYRLVLDTARSAFMKHGYDRASMDLIALEAGVSKATLYAYFENKQQLLLKLVEEECNLVGPAVPDVSDLLSKDIAVALRTIAQNFTSIFMNHQGLEFYRLIISNVRHFPEVAAMFMEAGPRRHQAEIACFFRQAVQRGLLEIDDIDRAVKHFLGLVAADLPLTWILAIQPPSPDQYKALINSGIRIFLNHYGVGRKAGRSAEDSGAM